MEKKQPYAVDKATVQRWCFLCMEAIYTGDLYAWETVKNMPMQTRSYHPDCYDAMREIRKNKYAGCVF